MKDPLERFQAAFEQAREEEPWEANAMTLATADGEGHPSARMVLLKGVDEGGFVFYTNYESRKAEQLEANPWAALVWWWPSQDLQVRAEGPVERVSEEDSDAYFASRSRGSQIGAWASKQSRPLSSRARLVARVAEMEARFAGRRVPRPPFWGGYRLRPRRIEFWYNQLHRLHDRRLYLRVPGDAADGEAGTAGWREERLYP